MIKRPAGGARKITTPAGVRKTGGRTATKVKTKVEEEEVEDDEDDEEEEVEGTTTKTSSKRKVASPSKRRVSKKVVEEEDDEDDEENEVEDDEDEEVEDSEYEEEEESEDDEEEDDEEDSDDDEDEEDSDEDEEDEESEEEDSDDGEDEEEEEEEQPVKKTRGKASAPNKKSSSKTTPSKGNTSQKGKKAESTSKKKTSGKGSKPLNLKPLPEKPNSDFVFGKSYTRDKMKLYIKEHLTEIVGEKGFCGIKLGVEIQDGVEIDKEWLDAKITLDFCNEIINMVLGMYDEAIDNCARIQFAKGQSLTPKKFGARISVPPIESLKGQAYYTPPKYKMSFGAFPEEYDQDPYKITPVKGKKDVFTYKDEDGKKVTINKNKLGEISAAFFEENPLSSTEE